ncbi:Mediator of RNA polymerase II transcription subunit 5 [Podosphaera aphanis]|nr:Mediator of RNA polymerase II transcription subunit 5 [Podosphaera aphanis]
MCHPVQIKAWLTLLDRSLTARLDQQIFSTYAALLYDQHPLSPSLICSLFLSPTSQNCYCLDPKASHYTLCLLSLGYVDIPSILRGLWLKSTCRTLAGEPIAEEDEKRWISSFTAEEILFYRLAKSIVSGSVPKEINEAIRTVGACLQWMESVTTAVHSQHQLQTAPHAQISELHAQSTALGTLIVSVVENVHIQNAIAKGYVAAGMRKRLREALTSFISIMFLHNSPQTASRLETFRSETFPAIEPVEKTVKNGIDMDIEEIIKEGLDSSMAVENIVVSEMAYVNTRAGLYVFLNSLLVGRPLIDDHAIFSFLQNRYQGDIQSTIVDLILASFDVLANATIRNEKDQTKNILRSFLINKLPVLLTTLCSQLFPPLTSEICITEALNHVDTTIFPTLSTMFDETNGSNFFPDSVRQDFCFSCCLHGLIAESSIENLLGDVPIQSLPAEGKYVKNDLVQKCLVEPERAEGMIDQLEQLDGNVGAVSQALAEVIAKLCSNKETMALKTICSKLSRKSSSLDVMLLFCKPISILQPICDLLDHWHYDEEQGEYQPVYEEFGSILLLLLCFVKRYDLTPICLGPRAPDSFVLKILQASQSSFPSPASPMIQTHLNSWILSLFSPENSGLTDDLMSSCPPQEFYLSIPALFYSIVIASSSYNLASTTMASGLEYLVDTFLIPSLVPGISFLSAHLWENRGDKDAVIQILSTLITSPLSNTNTEASQTLEVILDITAKDLEQSLRWLQRAEPQRQDIEPLSKVLRRHLSWKRCTASDHTELENWTSTPEGGLAMAIKQTLTLLLEWHLNPRENPANYTHRQILVGIKVLGAKRIIGIILDVLKWGIQSGHGGAALDITSAVVSTVDAEIWDMTYGISGLSDQAGEVQIPQRRMDLRQALKNEAENAPKLRRTDLFTAETVIRLYRKVESLLVMDDIGTQGVLASVELDAVVDGLTQSESVDIRGSIAGLERIDEMAQLNMEIDHMESFEGLSNEMTGTENFGGDGVNLMMEETFMGVSGQGGLLDGIRF